MSKASKAIALLLLPLSVIFLGFHGCEDDDSYATTRSFSGGSHGWFFGRSSYYGGSSYSGGGSRSSFSSGTSRGGFGSHGGSFGS
ncbi:MAG: hypothetical protein JWN40_979 [Phycisphaerales bacterium]|nr:hypothetical protein [Phycisphaerales bacterium]